MATKRSIKRFAPVLAVCLMAGTASAKNRRTVSLAYPASVNGIPIAAGVYDVSWVSHSPEATVTFNKGKNVIATTQGKWMDRSVKYERDSVMYTTNPDGSRTISEIRFAGMTQVLVFAEASSASQSLSAPRHAPAESTTAVETLQPDAASGKVAKAGDSVAKVGFLGKPGAFRRPSADSGAPQGLLFLMMLRESGQAAASTSPGSPSPSRPTL